MIQSRKMNQFFKPCMMAALAAILFVVYPTKSFAQGDCSTYAYCNPTTGYEIGRSVVLDLPGANSLAVGTGTLLSNAAIDNTAVGASALQANTSGPHNTAVGEVALVSNSTGGDNTSVGTGSLFFNTTGSGNTAIGYGACQSVTTANSVVCIGPSVTGANVSNTTYVSGIYNVRIPGKGDPLVCIDKAGQLGIKASQHKESPPDSKRGKPATGAGNCGFTTAPGADGVAHRESIKVASQHLDEVSH